MRSPSGTCAVDHVARAACPACIPDHCTRHNEERDSTCQSLLNTPVGCTFGELHHPCIVNFRTTADAQNAPSTDSAKTLSSAMTNTPAEKLFEYCQQVARGLEYAHSLGISHNDLHPSNIVITDGVAKISGFHVEHRDLATSRDQEICFNDNGAADIYSFGLVLLECASCSEEDRQGIVERAKQGLLPTLVPHRIFSNMQLLIRSMLSREIRRRPSISKVVLELERSITQSDTTTTTCIPAAHCQLLVSGLLDACVVADRRGCIIASNAAAETVFNYERGDMMQLTIHDLLPRHMRIQHRKWFEEYQRSGSNHMVGIRYVVPCQPKNLPLRTLVLTIGTVNSNLYTIVLKPHDDSNAIPSQR